MAKIKDQVPIPVTRTNKTSRIEIFLNSDDSISSVIAHRWTHTTQNDVEVSSPVLITPIVLTPTEVTVAIANKITDLEALIDAKDV